MDFIYYDVIFLVLFCLITAVFLYRNRKKLEIESKIIFLYKTKMGLDTIDRVGKKYPKLLNFLSYFVIISGYAIMALSIFSIVYLVKMMLYSAAVPKIAPIIPLIPYMPAIFKIDFLPPFYFTYWIITIAIIAVGHEFSHGVFARLNRIRLKSTGFGFIGPLLAAFVELDEKQMVKRPIKAQLSVLAAGSAANLILAFAFLLMMNGFFLIAYVPNGVMFNMYGVEKVNISSIYGINGIPVSNLYSDYMKFRGMNLTELEFNSNNKNYYGYPDLIDAQLKLNSTALLLYSDSPAYRSNLSGAIQKISSKGMEYGIREKKDLEGALSRLKPGDEVTVSTTEKNYTFLLAVHPQNASKAYLGIAYLNLQQSAMGKIVFFFSAKDPFIHYTPKYDGGNGKLIIFIYDLLYWIALINFSVMLVNMLPFGIFDGGRFFYLSALALTSKRKAKLAFRIINWMMIFILLLMMAVWMIRAF